MPRRRKKWQITGEASREEPKPSSTHLFLLLYHEYPGCRESSKVLGSSCMRQSLLFLKWACLSWEGGGSQIRQQGKDESWEEAGRLGADHGVGWGRRAQSAGEEVWVVPTALPSACEATAHVEPPSACDTGAASQDASTDTASSGRRAPVLGYGAVGKETGGGVSCSSCRPEITLDPR